ncbi:probable glycerol-3-phosphate acyltransferase 3 [Ananas comosus]|uniref:Probable glycerol-3-phosphate acyltransferase 3 n=1 Tax=Ananas comosus TaxID=4615 RepID=A0A6P5G7D2_ANACO|nr:probable glycerol-3-phosphate acyltransferase 3 [Ananas comosus]
MISKVLYKYFLFFYKVLLRRVRLAHGCHGKLQKSPPLEKLSNSNQAIVCDVEGGLLRSSSTFPYFMLVALEGGGFFRGLLLLVLYPLLCCVGCELGLRVMVMVCFFGIKREGFRVGKAILPKFLMEDVGLVGFEALNKGSKRVCVSRMPRVMVEGFLKDYLEVEVVIGRELKEFHGYYTGLMEEEGEAMERLDLKELMGMGDGVVGMGGYASSLHHPLFSLCKEVYLVSEIEKRKWQPLPRAMYPKPLVFHDGRIAFKPTPSSTLSMFLWLPLGVALAIARAVVFLFLPFKLAIPILALLGMNNTGRCIPRSSSPSPSSPQLFVCNHRTLLDPLYISAAVKRNLTATTYSLSRMSELLSPIKTIRLTRNKKLDREKMEKVLQDEGLVVCPEGTTCREPYLLRFSPLFAELGREIVPVALDSRVGMFYGTTAGGLKCLDPLYFLMNPIPTYRVEFLDKVDTTSIEGRGCNSVEVANYVQEKIAKALGFECTSLTRRDKYLMLAGNEGFVEAKRR